MGLSNSDRVYASDISHIGAGIEAAAVTPNDSTDIGPTRSLYVGNGGNMKVDMVSIGTAVTFSNVPGGTLLPVSVTRVYSTDTTASNIVAIR